MILNNKNYFYSRFRHSKIGKMPEGPEIYRESKYLNEKIKGYSLKAYEKRESYNIPSEDLLKDIMDSGAEIVEVYSKGKKTIISFGDINILISYGLTGEFLSSEEYKRTMTKNVPISFLFSLNGKEKRIYYHDPRGFGNITVGKRVEIKKQLASLGPDPIQEDVSYDDFLETFKNNRKNKIKVVNFLMDQKNIAGIGNKWVAEIMFATGLYPLAPLQMIPENHRRALFENIVYILREASKNPDLDLRVYRKTSYKDQVVDTIKNSGRTVYYVPSIQKIGI